ncbi:MAG TPA: cellulase family glycosylhydrolase, partial [Armatimonadota bacterium]|nr:cellulase family glycosylhydrolase [Armatimonadota bacterium]
MLRLYSGTILRVVFAVVACTIMAQQPRAGAASIIPLTAWQPRPDGGNPPLLRSGPDGLSLVYTDRPPHWGNVQEAMMLPADTTGIELDLTKRSAAPGAQMTLGLEEPDGDLWFGEARFNGKSLGQAPDGRFVTRVPIGQFQFQPRGNKIRQITSTRRLILILNNGDSSLVIHRIALDESRRASTPPPETPVAPVRGKRGAAAILTGPFPANPGAVDPAALARALQAAGIGTTAISGANACDPAVLNRAHFDLLALPNSPYYPAAGLQTLRQFLKAGGKLLCFGGYAFDHPTLYQNGRWVDASTGLTAAALDHSGASEQFNTRSGVPGDTMGLSPDQIGMFDPACRFQNASLVSVLGHPVTVPGKWSGYTAISVIGNDNPVFLKVWAVTTPLCLFQDPRGRKAPLASLAQIYSGPYRGSAWAFFGATDRDVLQIPAVRAALPEIINRLTGDVVIHDLSTRYALYHPGETPTASVVVDNFRATPLRATLALTTATDSGSAVKDEPSRRHPAFRDRFSLLIPPHSSKTYTRSIPITAAPGALCVIQASLEEGAGRDAPASGPGPSSFVLRPPSSETGFVIGDSPERRSKWPDFSFRDNAFRVNGKPEFLVGTNLTGAVFTPGNDENPLTWDHDFAAMAAHGVHLCRVLHFSPFVTWLKTGQSATAAELAGPLPEELMRRLDALLQIAAHHGVALFLGVDDWIPVAVSDRDLSAEQSFVARVARRYRGVKNLIFDIQNEPSVETTDDPDVRRLWNDYLRTKYHDDAALKMAWHLSPPDAPLGQIPWKPGTDEWADVRTWDFNHFKTVLLNRWTAANAAGLHAGDPSRPVTVGYLPSLPPADKILGQKNLDFSDMHYYGSPDGLPLEFALTDRRFEGKGLSIGEFGAQDEHDQRVNGQDVTADDSGWFERLGAVAMGMGAAFVENWCWKDMNGVVFPWGVIGRDGR